jgi:hypothetical protein
MITFRLHRKGVILIALGAVLLGFLLFAAGYLAALRMERKESAAKPHIEDEAFARPIS